MATVGAVWINVLPSMRNFAAQAGAQASAAARTAGRTSGAAMGASMAAAAGTGLGRQAPRHVAPAARKVGAQAGSAAATATGQGISRQRSSITGALSGALVGAISAASSAGVREAGQAWSRAGESMAQTGSRVATRVSLPIAAVGGIALNSAGDFESSMNRVRAVTGVTGGDLDDLTGLAQQLGSTTQFSAGQAADAMGFLGMAGFDTTEILEALPGTLDLAAAGNIELAEAADIASNVLSGYGLEAGDITRVNDAMAKTMTEANVDLQMLGQSMQYVGPVAAGAGIELEETAAAVGLLGNAGIQGSQAGTVLRGAISRLLNPTAQVQEAMDRLGVSATDSSGELLPLTDIVGQLETSGASAADMMQIFGTEAGPGMQALVSEGSGALGDLTGELRSAGGTAQEMADVQMEGLNGSLTELKSAAEGLWIAIGDAGVLDTATEAVQRLTSGVQSLSQTNPELLRFVTIGAGIAAAIGPAVWIGGQLVSTAGSIAATVGAAGRGLQAAAGTAQAAAAGWRNINTAMADGAPLATRLAAAVRSQILLWNQQAAAQGRSTAALILHNTWSRIVRVATAAWTGVQWALNAALNANPIGLIVIAIAALVAGVILAYQRFEGFRNAVDTVWGAIRGVVSALQPLWDVLLGIGKILLGIAIAPLIGAFLVLRAVAMALWQGVLQPAFSWIAGFWRETLQPALADFAAAATALWQEHLQPAFAAIAAFVRDRLAAAFTWLWERVSPVLTAIGEAAMWLWENALQPAGQALQEFFSGAADSSVMDIAVTVLQTLGEAATWLWNTALQPLVQGFTAGLQVLGGIVSWLWTTIIEPVFGFIWQAAKFLFVVVAVAVLAPLYIAFQVLGAVISWLWETVVQPVFSLIAELAIWLWETVIQPAWIAFQLGLQVLGAVLMWLWAEVIQPVFNFIAELALWLWQTVIQPTWAAFQIGLQVLGAAISWLWTNVVQPVFNFIGSLIAAWWAGVQAIFNIVVNVVRTVLGAVFTWLRDNIIRPVWSGIRAAISAAWSFISGIFATVVSTVRNTLATVFTWLRDNIIRPVWNGISSVISSVWNGGIRPAFDAVRDGVDKVKSAFETARDGIRTAWQKLRSITRKPVKFIVNTIYNDGIRKIWNKIAGLVDMSTLPKVRGFWSGGIYPGYTPGRDVGVAAVSGGEAIMRPEWTRAVGEEFVQGGNAAARSGGVGGVQRYLASIGVAGDPGAANHPNFRGRFAGGGVVPFAGAFDGGGLVGRLSDFASAAAGWFTDGLRKAAETVIDPVLDSALDLFGDTRFGEAAVGVPRTAVDNWLDWLDEVVDPKMGGDGRAAVQEARSQLGVPYSWGGGGLNGPTRGFGRGAGITGFDCSSLMRYAWYQAVGKVSPRTTYTQEPWVNKIGSAKPGAFGFVPGHVVMASDKDGHIIEAPYTGAHVRERSAGMGRYSWGMPPWQLDDGGYMQPGLAPYLNATGRPEPVLTDAQWEDMHRIARNSSDQHGHVFHVYETRNPRATGRRVATALRDYEALHP